MPTFRHDGINFAYEQFGNGPVVVLTHGLSGDSTLMRELLGELKGHSILLWDCRGHGDTEPVGSPEKFTFSQFASDLHALLAHLGIQQAVVGGVSMGAAVSVRFALDWPGMVDRLVLLRPAWLDKPSPSPLHPILRIGDLLSEYGVVEGRRRFEHSAEFAVVQRLDQEEALRFCEQFAKPKADERAVRLQHMPRDCPIRNWQELSQLTMPALVVGCENDYVHPLEFAKEWSRQLPVANLVQICAKSISAELHNHAFQAALQEFLSRPHTSCVNRAIGS